MTLEPVGLVGGGRIQATVGLEVRRADEVKTEFRPLTKEFAEDGEGCGRGGRQVQWVS